MTRNTNREANPVSPMGRRVLIALAIVVWYVVISTAVGIANGLTGSNEFPRTETTTTTTTETTTEFDDFDNLIRTSPKCWEDEVIVLVIWDPYGDLDANNIVGCVPADNLPVTGYRP